MRVETWSRLLPTHVADLRDNRSLIQASGAVTRSVPCVAVFLYRTICHVPLLILLLLLVCLYYASPLYLELSAWISHHIQVAWKFAVLQDKESRSMIHV